MELYKKKVLVFGTGISGIGACKLLHTVGASITLYDENTSKSVEMLQEQLVGHTVEIVLGQLEESRFGEFELIVLSPGVPTDLPMIEKFRVLGIPIWGEIELAYVVGKGEVLAITGTNGKTTTTALLGEIMKVHNPETYVVGNIGNPYADIALKTTDNSVIVAELSSFQLETIQQFKPVVSAILNLTPDHLNRHHTMEAYIEAKKRIAKNQGMKQVCVLNYEDDVTREFGKETKSGVLYFSSRHKLDKGIYLDKDNIIYRDTEEVVLCNVKELKLLGIHNYENVMAAAAMAIVYGVTVEVVRQVICSFAGVEHRIEFVCEKQGVMYYNDSKGTNPDAAIKGIQAMNRPTVLIGGGYDKDSEYTEWIQSFEGKVKYLVLTGQTREKIAETARRNGFENIILEDDFDEAVKKSIELATSGDAVLLSPACASWGAFDNYEQRGDKFKEIVKSL